MILIYLFTAVAATPAATFRGVPADCQAELEAIPAVARAASLDWRPLVRHLRRTNIIAVNESLTARWFGWRTPDMRDQIRRALGNKNWTWTDGFTDATSRKFGRDPIFNPRQLPFLIAIRGFDTTAAMEGFLTTWHYPPSLERAAGLKASAPCWLGGPDGARLAETFWAHTNRTRWSSAIEVVADQLGAADRSRFVRRVLDDITNFRSRDIEDTATLLRSLPYHRDSNSLTRVRRPLRRNWINFDRHPPVRLPGVRVAQHRVHRAGQCGAMTRGHLATLQAPDAAQPTLLFVGEILIGFVKSIGHGDRSLLALRNVVDAGGRPVMAMGGAYMLSDDVPLHRAERTARDCVWRLRIEALGVRPLDFISNRYAWTSIFLGSEGPVVWSLGRTHIPASSLEAARRALTNPDEPPSEDISRVLWFALLDRMAEFRAEMEALR